MPQYIISGTLDELKEDFEHELLTGAETFAATIDAGHVAIVMDDGVDVSETERLGTAILRLAEKFAELGYVAT